MRDVGRLVGNSEGIKKKTYRHRQKYGDFQRDGDGGEGRRSYEGINGDRRRFDLG